MAERDGKTDAPALPPLDDGAVARYLRDHPAFLDSHPDLFDILTPAERRLTGDAVLDFQRYALDRMKNRMAHLGEAQSKLIAASRSNLASQKQIHRAVLMALDANTLEELTHRITADWTDTLGVDVITLCFESAAPLPALVRAGLRRLEPGVIEHALRRGDAILLRGEVEGDRRIFGPAAALVAAEALVRIDLGLGPEKGILAFGSRDPASFYPGQGTELLKFLRDVTGRLFRRCLEKHGD